ncbi:MAG TPA: hypothetical protein VL134_00590 [Leptolyngbya sp.]|jgi:hypothetical protein|nr:hypothetical protein [Leptolyngbya sp.]
MSESSQQSTASQSSSDQSSKPPTIDYWHVWADGEGVSHQTRCTLEEFSQKSIAPTAAPQWMSQLKQSDADVVFTVMPVGWVGEWHENPKPQWIVPLSGRWFVETMDGQRVEMGTGEISFGEDQGTTENAQGHKGHLSGTVGDEPVVLMLVQLKDAPIKRSCHFQ